MKKLKKPKANLSTLSKNTNVDTKLTRTALLLSYAFEYGVDFENRTIKITSEIDVGFFDVVDAAMTIMEAENKSAITIKVHSFGGCIYEAMAIVGRMESSKCQVNTEGYGAIMSAATVIFGAGRHRRMSSRATMMWHEMSYGFGEGTRHSTIKKDAEQVDEELKRWAIYMEERSNKPASFWLKNGKHVDKYFYPEELLEMEYVTEVI